MAFFLLLALSYLLVYSPSSCEGLPHDFSSAYVNKGHLLTMADLSQFDSATRHEQQTILRKDSLHPSSIKSNLEAKYYTAVSVITKKSSFSVAPRFLSISVSPRKVAGTSCIPWDNTTLQVYIYTYIYISCRIIIIYSYINSSSQVIT